MTALGQPLWMATHASDWGISLNQCRRGGKRVTRVMMFVGGVVLMFDRSYLRYRTRMWISN